MLWCVAPLRTSLPPMHYPLHVFVPQRDRCLSIVPPRVLLMSAIIQRRGSDGTNCHGAEGGGEAGEPHPELRGL